MEDIVDQVVELFFLVHWHLNVLHLLVIVLVSSLDQITPFGNQERHGQVFNLSASLDQSMGIFAGLGTTGISGTVACMRISLWSSWIGCYHACNSLVSRRDLAGSSSPQLPETHVAIVQRCIFVFCVLLIKFPESRVTTHRASTINFLWCIEGLALDCFMWYKVPGTIDNWRLLRSSGQGKGLREWQSIHKWFLELSTAWPHTATIFRMLAIYFTVTTRAPLSLWNLRQPYICTLVADLLHCLTVVWDYDLIFTFGALLSATGHHDQEIICACWYRLCESIHICALIF